MSKDVVVNFDSDCGHFVGDGSEAIDMVGQFPVVARMVEEFLEDLGSVSGFGGGKVFLYSFPNLDWIFFDCCGNQKLADWGAELSGEETGSLHRASKKGKFHNIGGGFFRSKFFTGYNL